jgi:DNA-binding beta-propeller fold protein YncE
MVVSCGGLTVQRTGYEDRIGWPPENPRVRLVSVIELGGETARRRPVLLSDSSSVDRAPSFQRPYAVTWLEDDLLVADPGTGRVARIGVGGKVFFSKPNLFTRPMGIASCPGGIFVTDAQTGIVSALDEDLDQVSTLVEGLLRPTGVACWGDEVLVVETGRHRVLAFRSDGETRILGGRGSQPGQFNYPTTIAVDGSSSADEVLVGDAMNFRVQALGANDGSFLRQFGRLGDAPGEMPRIKGVVIEGGSRVWVSDAHLDRISLYDLRGKLLLAVGGRGTEPGEFSFPAGMAVHPDGRVAVIDSYNRRIQILRVDDSKS